ncbi:MAG: dTDP-4-dehydrorhamnose 3,5-epimerase [Rickettsiales bacterium]|nr:dTDP-4-dehydrorhamnose 3,5-epimerase [Rickettsiales bacterium]|tara:strand:+ start:1310 stop:1867 length:558 start_codon:yes stop_codon:yes gene_type:complete
MKLNPLPLDGAILAECEPFEDPRGLFARLFCDRELEEILGERSVRNINLSQSNLSGTLRGLHYQLGDSAEMKLVRCTRGSIFDVIVDMRPESPTYLHWHGEILTQRNMRMMVVPEYFAHGFQALEDNCEIMYLVTAHYAPGQEAGVRWDDPKVGIKWPLEVNMLSDKDANFPLLDDRYPGKIRAV